MLQLLSIVEGGSVIPDRRRVARFSNLEACEGVYGHEGGEVHAITGATEHILVEQEVGAEEDQSSFEVDHGRVRRPCNKSWLSSVHIFSFIVLK